jgi:hypothetical protein
MGLFSRLFRRRKRLGKGFAEDPALASLLDAVLEGCEYVLGAGDGAALVLAAEARRYPGKEFLACEPGPEKCHDVGNRAEGIKNLYLHNRTPADFLELLARDKPYLFSRDVLFYLSALGGGGERHLFDEISFVAGQFHACFLLLSGLKVPERDEFAYATHRGRECSLKNVTPCLAGATGILHLPAYPVKPSRRRVYKGWGLFCLGRNAEFVFPESLAGLLHKGAWTNGIAIPDTSPPLQSD